MSFVPKIQLDLQNFDPVGRLRISQPHTVFESENDYFINPYLWSQSKNSDGYVTHLPNQNAVRLRTNTANGAYAIHQTKKYFRYQQGKSQLISLTAIVGSAKANVTQRWGAFDGYNGIFFEQTSAGLSVVVRSYVSGVANDTPVARSAWSIDKLDGTGPSRVNIDVTKILLYVVDFRYLGSGEIRFGVATGGEIHYCHETKFSNNLTTVFMSTPHLPIRFEIRNTNTTASDTDLIQVCTSVVSEGRTPDILGSPFGIHNTALRATSATRLPLLSIRAKDVFKGKTNRGEIVFRNLDILSVGETFVYELFYNGVLTNPSWVSVHDNSITEYDISATAINVTGAQAVNICSGLCVAGTGHSRASSTSLDIAAFIPLTVEIDGQGADIFTICVTTYSGTGTASSCLNWKEYI